jgi:phospholipid transport system substrate-binding protein
LVKVNLAVMILALVLAVGWSGPAASMGEVRPDAMGEIHTLGNRVLDIAKDPSCKTNRNACREKLRSLIEQYWDTTGMARSALGYHWKTLDPQQRQQFTKLFAHLVESIYLSRSNFSKAQNYTNSVKVDYLRETSEGDDYRKIDTQVTLKAGEKPVNVDYRVKWVDGKWKVYDIIVESISLAGNYRNQFNRIINSKGYPELVRAIQNKLQQIKQSEQGT